jgi:tetratricopeptide (TPR) repeat protein
MRFFPVIFALTLPLACASFDLLPLGLSEKEAIAQSIIKISQANSTYEAEFNRLIDNGIARFQRKDYEGAIAIYQEALSLAKQNQNLQYQSMVFWLLGKSYDVEGKYLLAENSFKAGLGLIAQLENGFYSNVQERVAVYRLRVFLMTGLGITYSHIGEYTQATKQLELAFALSANTTNESKLVLLNYFETRFELAQLYQKQGKYKKAIDLFQHSRLLALQIGDRQKEAISLTAIGNNLVKIGNVATAQEFYDMAKKLGDSHQEPQIAIAPKRVNAALGNFANLSDFFEKIIPSLQKANQIIRKMAKLTGSDNRFVVLGELSDNLDQSTQSMSSVLKNLKQGNWTAASQTMNDLQKKMSEMQNNSTILRNLLERMRQNPAEFNNSFSPQTIKEWDALGKELNSILASLQGGQKNADKFKQLKKKNLLSLIF